MVVIANRRTADGHDDVVTSRQLLENLGKRVAVVADVMRKNPILDLARQHRREHHAVAVGDLPWCQRASGLDEFVAGGEDRDPRAPSHREFARATHRRGSDCARGQARARGKQAIAGCEIGSLRPDMAPARAGAVTGQPQSIAFTRDIFLHDHRVGAGRNHRAGEYPHSFAGPDRLVGRSARGGFPDDGPRARKIAEPDRIAVHRR